MRMDHRTCRRRHALLHRCRCHGLTLPRLNELLALLASEDAVQRIAAQPGSRMLQSADHHRQTLGCH